MLVHKQDNRYIPLNVLLDALRRSLNERPLAPDGLSKAGWLFFLPPCGSNVTTFSPTTPPLLLARSFGLMVSARAANDLSLAGLPPVDEETRICICFLFLFDCGFRL